MFFPGIGGGLFFLPELFPIIQHTGSIPGEERHEEEINVILFFHTLKQKSPIQCSSHNFP
jgi:hypothetical protein